jgi:hypothetical protein
MGVAMLGATRVSNSSKKQFVDQSFSRGCDPQGTPAVNSTREENFEPFAMAARVVDRLS